MDATTSPAPFRRQRALAALGKGLATLAVLVLAVPFLIVSVALSLQVPARLWPEDFATPGAVRDAAVETPHFPFAEAGLLVADDPTQRQWFGFKPPEYTAEIRFWLPRPFRTESILEFYQVELPRLGWTHVRTERDGGGARAEYRRHQLAFILTVNAAPAITDAQAIGTQSYRFKVGAWSSQEVRR